MLSFHSERTAFIQRVLSDPREAAIEKDSLLRCLFSRENEEESHRLASFLPYVLTVDDVRLLHEPRVAADAALLPRIIWALGETHRNDIAPYLLPFVNHEDDHVVGVALTAVAKCDPSAGDDLQCFRTDGRRLVRTRYLEGFVSRSGFVWETPEVTFIQVKNAAALGAESGEYADVLSTRGLNLDVHWRWVPAVEGPWAGLWATWVLPFVSSIAANWVGDWIREGYSRVRSLKRRGEIVHINSGFARVIAEAELISNGNECCRLVRAIIRREDSRMAEDMPCAYYFEFEVQGGRVGFTVSTSGDIEQIGIALSDPPDTHGKI